MATREAEVSSPERGQPTGGVADVTATRVTTAEGEHARPTRRKAAAALIDYLIEANAIAHRTVTVRYSH